jgi:WD40 repeat protein
VRIAIVSMCAWLVLPILAACSTGSPVATPSAPPVTPSPIPPAPTSADVPTLPLVPITLENARDVCLLKTLPIPDFAVSRLSQCSVDFSPDGKMLSGVCYENTTPVWDVASGRLLFSLMPPSHVVAVSFSPDGKTIATGDYTGDIGLYSAATGELLRTFTRLPSAIWELDFSPMGDRLASASFYSGMQLADVSSGESLWNHGEKDGLRVLSVNYHPAGETIAFGTLSKGVMILNAQTGQPIKILPIAAPVGDVTFSPDGQWLAAGGDDNKIRLWRTTDYELVKILEGHTHYVNGIAFSPAEGGRWLVSGSHDKTVGIWDVQSGQRVKSLEGHEGVVLRVAVNSAGTLIASISWDGTVRLWGIAKV